jgi:hypothetical protein
MKVEPGDKNDHTMPFGHPKTKPGYFTATLPRKTVEEALYTSN